MADKFIPQYVADQILGEGAFGRVYRIHNQRAEDFALKVLRPKFKGEAGNLAGEVKVLAQLSHPNLLAIHEYIPQVSSIQGVEEKGPGYVMEYIPGKSLEELGEETSWEDWENYLVQCLRGLHYLHRRHLLHGDLKPGNLKLGKKNIVKILDFGLAGRLGEKEGEILGTLDYLAPEALRGARTTRSDLFSLGVVFYRLMAGKPPYDPQMELSQRFLAMPQSLKETRSEIPAYLSDLIQRMIEPSAEKRFSSALNVIRALNQNGGQTYEVADGAQALSILETIPFIGRASILTRQDARLMDWVSDEIKCPVWVVSGRTGSGATRLLEELEWQAKLKGIETRTFAADDDFSQLETIRDRSSERELWFFSDIQNLEKNSRNHLLNFLSSFEVKGRHLGLVLEWNEDRIGEFAGTLDEKLASLSQVEKIPVPNFSSEETRAFVEEVFFEKPLSERVHRDIRTASEGNPLLLKEMVRWFLEQGGIPYLERDFRLSDLEGMTLPEGLRAWVRQQWEDWTDPERQLLVSLFFLRTPFALSELSGLLSLSPTEVQPAVVKFSEAGWIHSDAGKVQFSRIPYGSYLRELLGAKATKQLQSRLLHHLKQSGCKDDVLLSRLAWGAQDFEDFRNYGMTAAEILKDSGHAQEALKLFQDLLTVSPSTPQRILIFAHQAATLARLARYDDALKAYDQWYEVTEDDGTDIQTIKYHYLTGLVYLNRGDLSKAKQKLELALSTGDSTRYEHHIPFHLKSLILLGKVYEKENKKTLARQTYEKGLKLAKSDSADKSQLLRNMGLLFLGEGDREQGKIFLQDSLAMSLKLQYDEGTANTAYILANLAHQEGQYDLALRTYGQVLEIAERQQDPLKRARTFSNMASVLVEIADYGRAYENALKAQEIIDEKGTDLDRFLKEIHLATVQTYLGNFHRLDVQALGNLARTLGPKSKSMLAYLERLEAEALRLQRDFKGALQGYENARRMFREAGDDREFNVTLLHEVLTECLAGDLQAARDKLKRWDDKKVFSEPGNLAEFFDLISTLLDLTEVIPLEAIQEKIHEVLKSGQQEFVILTLLGCSEILTRLDDQPGAQLLRRKAYEWLEGLYRGLPEEMQISFENREDFKRLAEARLQKLKATGISRDRFLTFAKINKRLSEESDILSILQQVMDAAMALAGAERGFLLIRDEASPSPVIHGFRVEAARNMKKENIGTEEFKISLSVVEEAIRRRVAILTDDAQADPNFQNAESVHLYQLKSILVLPLVGETGCMGALYLDHRFEVGAFSEEGLLFLKSFADQAVLAIEKAQTLQALHEAKLALENRVEEQAHQIEQMEVQLKEARQGLKFGYEEIVGHSPNMIKVLRLLDRVTDTQVPVWIHGESGTGKELIARALHYNSDRKEKPFITENCSAIPENLLESVLFGHVKGAFTHADRDKMGLFEAANGGTIFLDEIGDMPMPMQAKLLRVLQEGEIRRVGSNDATPIDVRVVSATNKDLPRMVQQGKFREDLFFRLNGMKIELPPLRDRKEDIPPLVHFFIRKVAEENQLPPCSIGEEALGVLAQYDWPGNIRELENAVRNAVLFSDGQTITRDTLGFKPELFGPPAGRPKAEILPEEKVTPEMQEKKVLDAQREAILDALVKAAFHKGQAAKELNVTPRHLYNLLEKYELPKNKWALKKLVEEERGN